MKSNIIYIAAVLGRESIRNSAFCNMLADVQTKCKLTLFVPADIMQSNEG